MTCSGKWNSLLMNLCIRERKVSLLSGKPAAFTVSFMSLFKYSTGFISGEYFGR